MNLKKMQILLGLMLCLCGVALGGTTYTNKYDDVDLDVILNSDRLLTNYVKCLKNEGPCTPDAAELKSNCFYYYDRIDVNVH